MNDRRNDLITRLDNLRDEETRVDLNDWAVNTLRRAGILRSGVACSKADLCIMIRQEANRMTDLGITRDGAGLIPFLRCRRAGSEFRLSRNAREAVFVLIATRSI